jgi:peptidylprolyl isomerase
VISRPVAAAALVLSAALALTACGSSSGTDSGSSASASSSGYVTGTAGVTVTGDLGSKPTVKLGETTKDTAALTVSDLVVGSGDVVEAGDSVTAQYVGIGAASGKEFDSSWSRGTAAQFSLDQVIEGWQQGIPGMKVGGRRLLVIPGAMAYGENPPSGSTIGKNETLVFVVDLVPTPEATVGPRVTGTAGVTVTGDPGKEPTITVAKETATTKQVTINDITVGDGDEAKANATVTINYVGVGANTGKVFDSSWTNGDPVPLVLTQVISGFKDGVAGMKVGGRRLVVIPAAQAYGDNPPSGSGISKGENLVFVVDLVSVK